jgi:hypothetical protein
VLESVFSREKAGLWTGCGVRSQVIDVLEAQIQRRPATNKVSTAVAKQSGNISQQRLTIGLDLGDRNSWYCVMDETGQIQLEQRVRTTATGRSNEQALELQCANPSWQKQKFSLFGPRPVSCPCPHSEAKQHHPL